MLAQLISLSLNRSSAQFSILTKLRPLPNKDPIDPSRFPRFGMNRNEWIQLSERGTMAELEVLFLCWSEIRELILGDSRTYVDKGRGERVEFGRRGCVEIG